MDTLIQDMRYGIRRIVRSPAFSATVVLTLALGIGANTAIFSLVDALLLRSLPYEQPSELATVYHLYPSLNGLEAPVSASGFRTYGERLRSFESIAVQSGWAANLTGTGEPERLRASRVSADWFGTYGAVAVEGRTFRQDEDIPGANRVVVLSDGLWKRRFGARLDILGSVIQLNGEPYEIVGVMGDDFHDFFYSRAELWTPLALTPDQLASGATNEWLAFTGRVRQGTSLEAAAEELRLLAESLKQENAGTYPDDWSLRLEGLEDHARSDVRTTLFVLLGAVGFVLLIACANVANLQLARAASRQREAAVRRAIGAPRHRLVRQLLTESVLLGIAGGALGLLLSLWGVRGLTALLPPAEQAATDVRIDTTVLVFTLLVSIGAGLLFGLVPALQLSRANAHDALREGGRSGADRGAHLTRRILVVAEIALALALLTGAGLMIRSVGRLQDVNPGFRAQNVLTFNLFRPSPSDTTMASLRQYYRRVLEEITARPGVIAAGGTSVLPFSGNWSTGSFNVEGYTTPDGQPRPWGDIRIATPGYAEALGIPLVRGRWFTEFDTEGAARVIVVDEDLANRYWPGEDAIGKRITRGDPANPDATWYEVVGVVGHTMHEGLDADPRVQLYFSADQIPPGSLNIVVRTQQTPENATAAVRQAVRSADPDVPLANLATMEELIERSIGNRAVFMTLLGVFAALALALASLGIYGVMSYVVAQRSREIGVRMALGARAGDVLRMVMGQGLVVVGAGIALGLLGSLGLTGLLRNQLFGTEATDPVTFIAVCVVIAGVALAAMLLPARRATRLDPVRALRQE
jgi:predicted permease